MNTFKPCWLTVFKEPASGSASESKSKVEERKNFFRNVNVRPLYLTYFPFLFLRVQTLSATQSHVHMACSKLWMYLLFNFNWFSQTCFTFLIVFSFIISYFWCPQKQDRLFFKAKQEKEVCHTPLCISFIYACTFVWILTKSLSLRMPNYTWFFSLLEIVL